MKKIYILATGLSTAFVFASSFLCATILGDALYGISSIIISTVTVSSSISSSAFVARTTYLVANNVDDQLYAHRIWLQGALGSLIISFICSFALCLFSYESVKANGIAFILPVAVATSAVYSIDRYMRFVYISVDKIIDYALLCALPSAFFLLTSVLLSYYFSLVGYVFALLLSALFVGLVNLYLAVYRLELFKNIIPEIQSLFLNSFQLLSVIKYSKHRQELDVTLPNLLSSMIGLFPFWFASIIILSSPLGPRGVGMSTIFYQFFLAASFVPSMLALRFLQHDSSRLALIGTGISSPELKARMIKKLLIKRSIFFLKASSCCIVLVPLFALALFKFYNVGSLVQAFLMSAIVILSIICSSSAYAFSNALVGSGMGWLGFFANIAWALIFLLSVFTLSQNDFAYVMPVSLLVSYAIHALYLWILLILFPLIFVPRPASLDRA